LLPAIGSASQGNLSKIFGELMLLIEPDKRSPDWAVKLAYAESPEARFYVPPTCSLLGLMNTVRRQSFWDSELVHLREALARLLGDVMRPADDAASVDW
jgi:hypothetical protein